MEVNKKMGVGGKSSKIGVAQQHMLMLQALLAVGAGGKRVATIAMVRWAGGVIHHQKGSSAYCDGMHGMGEKVMEERS